MGYHVSARGPADPGQRPRLLAAMKIGPYGAQDVLLAMLLAGYAQGRFPHSDRIRGSWVGPRRGIRRDLPHAVLPPFLNTRTRSGFAAWVGFNHDERTWLEINPASIARGRLLKPIQCEVLTALLTFYDQRDDFTDPARGFLDEAATAALADAAAACLPGLLESCWYPTVAEFAYICTQAATAGGTLHYG